MAKHRVGVALLFDAQTRGEIDGLRRGLGEPDIGKIPPHLTLVPPVNVRDLGAAERVVRAAAGNSKPFILELGPVETFLPENPVAYLKVSGNLDALHQLREAIFVPPLERELSWPFVPHVTVADGIDPARIAAAPNVLGSFEIDIKARAVTLLEETGRVWRPVTAFALGPPIVIGRGGQPIELDVLAGDTSVTVTARRDGVAVGQARGWQRGKHAWLSRLAVAEEHRRDGIASHLLAAVQSWAADGGAVAIEFDLDRDLGPEAAAFLTSRGWMPGPARLRRLL